MFLIIFLLNIELSEFTPPADTVLYHSFAESTSSWYITQWNISVDSLPKHYVTEKIDHKGRIIELKFFEYNNLISQMLCDDAPIIKFDYPNDSTIVVSKFWDDGIYAGSLECNSESKITYHFNPYNYFLTYFRSELIMSEKERAWWLSDEGGFTEEQLDSSINSIFYEGKNPRSIYWYSFSYNKLNGISPVNKDFNIDKIPFLPFDELMKKRILETLPKINAH